MKIWAIVLAAGSGKRMGRNQNKIFLPLGGVPAIVRSVAAFTGFCEKIIVCHASGEDEALTETFRCYGLSKYVQLVCGGKERQDSVRNALNCLPEDTDMVMIHDGARALVTEEIIRLSLLSANEKGSGIAAVPVTDTIKKADSSGLVTESLNRSELYAMQTPQAFSYPLIMKAHLQAEKEHYYATDDAALLSYIGENVYLTPGSNENIKLTTPIDLALAEVILQKRKEKEQEKC